MSRSPPRLNVRCSSFLEFSERHSCAPHMPHETDLIACLQKIGALFSRLGSFAECFARIFKHRYTNDLNKTSRGEAVGMLWGCPGQRLPLGLPQSSPEQPLGVFWGDYLCDVGLHSVQLSHLNIAIFFRSKRKMLTQQDSTQHKKSTKNVRLSAATLPSSVSRG